MKFLQAPIKYHDYKGCIQEANGKKKKRIPGLIRQQVRPVILTMPFHAVHGPVLMLLL